MESNANIAADTAMHTNLRINYETPFLSRELTCWEHCYYFQFRCWLGALYNNNTNNNKCTPISQHIINQVPVNVSGVELCVLYTVTNRLC